MYFVNEKGLILEDINLSAERFADFIQIVLSDKINRQTGKAVFEKMVFSDETFDIDEYIVKNGLAQVDDSELVRNTILKVFSDNPKTVEQYKSGETKVQGFFVGQVMKALRGTARPDTVNKLLAEELTKL